MLSQLLRAIIVQNTSNPCSDLPRLVQRYCPQIRICASANTLDDARALIRQHRPAFIFWEINPADGLDILDALPRPEYNVVFITPDDEPLVNTLRYRACHYLLRPVVAQELVALVKTLQKPASGRDEPDLLLAAPINNQHRKLILRTIQGIAFVGPDEISFIFADDKYATIALSSGEKMFVSHSLKDMETILPPNEFVRPHQSCIVRIDAIRKMQRGEGWFLVLKDKTTVPVSRRNKDMVWRALGLE